MTSILLFNKKDRKSFRVKGLVDNETYTSKLYWILK